MTPVKVALLPSSYPTNPGHALSVTLLSLGGAALFPIVAPALLCGVVGTRELLGGAPLSEIGDWLTILAAFDIAFLTTGTLLFEPLMQD